MDSEVDVATRLFTGPPINSVHKKEVSSQVLIVPLTSRIEI